MTRIYQIFALALLSACSGTDDSTAPGRETAGEAKALDDAAEMLEERRLPEAVTASPAAAAPQASDGKGTTE